MERARCVILHVGFPLQFWDDVVGTDIYCSYNEIRTENTVRGTPRENGVSERMNRTIMECARCM